MFIAIVCVFMSAGYLALAEQERQFPGVAVVSPSEEQRAHIQPIGCWFHQGSDPLLGAFEETIELAGIGTFRSEIYAPSFQEEPIIIRGFWRRGEDASIGLYASNALVNEIRYDPAEGVFVNMEGYRYVRVFSRDVNERMHMIRKSAFFATDACWVNHLYTIVYWYLQ